MNGGHAPALDRQVLRKLARGSVELRMVAKNSLSEIFHENTKVGRWNAREYAARMASATTASIPIGRSYKTYTLLERRALPPVEAQSDLERAIATRRSVRTFSGQPLGIHELARLLFFTYGITDPRGLFRAVSSGGALYPLEIYVVSLKVDDLDPGIYHYGMEGGHLDIVTPGDALTGLKDAVFWQGVDIDRAALAIVITAAFRRTTVKYGDRGYRMVLYEAGEAAQNLTLVSTSMGLGACLLGGFQDDLLSEFLDIDGVNEAPLITAVVGRPAAPTTG